MDNPVEEITPIIQTLCTASPSAQQQAIETYFTPTASFTHPFCRTGSFDGSRWLILKIYQWYKILSPRIEVTVDSVTFDEQNMLLYVRLRQIFSLFFVPWQRANVNLVTVLELTTDPYPHYHVSESAGEKSIVEQESQSVEVKGQQQRAATESSAAGASEKKSTTQESKQRRMANGRAKYYIQSQNDLYQTNEFVKFASPTGLLPLLLVSWQFFATFMSVLGALALAPVTALYEHVLGGNLRRVRNGEVL